MELPVWLFVPNLIGYVRIISGLLAFVAARDPARWAEFFLLYAFSYSLDAVDGVAARKLGQTSRLGAVLDMVTDRFCTAGLLSVLAALYPAWHWVFTFLMILDIVSHWAQMYRCAVVMCRGCFGRRGVGARHTRVRVLMHSLARARAAAPRQRQRMRASGSPPCPSPAPLSPYPHPHPHLPPSSLAGGFGSHKAVADETPLLRFYYTYPYALFWVCTFNESFLAMLFLLAHEPAVVAAT